MYFVCTINMRKERFVSKQGHRQPCKHSKAWILSLQLQMTIIMDVIQRERERRYCLPTEHQLLKIIIKTLHGIKRICTVIDNSFNCQFGKFHNFPLLLANEVEACRQKRRLHLLHRRPQSASLEVLFPPLQYLMNFRISVKYNKSAPT